MSFAILWIISALCFYEAQKTIKKYSKDVDPMEFFMNAPYQDVSYARFQGLSFVLFFLAGLIFLL